MHATRLVTQLMISCRNSREAMDKIVEILLEKETMSGDEFRSILSKYTNVTIPPASDPMETIAGVSEI